MKLLLLTVACLAIASAAPSDRKQRDILPGDPRYGTDYHHQHHEHHKQPDDVQILRSVGGYAGSYTVPESSYGPPTHNPGNPITSEYLPPTSEPVKQPKPTYGAPQVSQQVSEVQDNFIPTAVEDVKAPQVPGTSYGTPLTGAKSVQTHTVKSDYSAPSVDAPITSYGTPISADVKSTEHVQVSPPTYGTPALKTNIESHREHNTEHAHVLEKAPEVHHEHVHVEEPKVKGGPQAAHGKESVHQTVTDHGSFGGLPSGSFDGSFGSGSLGSTSGFGSFSNLGGVSSGYPSFGGSVGNGFGSSPSLLHSYGTPSFGIHSGYSSFPSYGSGYSNFGSLGHTVHLPSQQFVHHGHHVQRGNPFQDFLDSVNIPNFEFPQIPDVPFQFPSFDFPQVPQVPQIPQIPQVPQIPQIPSASPVPQGSHVTPVQSGGVQVSHDTVTVENPIAETPLATQTVVSPPVLPSKTFKEPVQATAANGGYVY